MRAGALKEEAGAECAVCDTFTDILWGPYFSHLQTGGSTFFTSPLLREVLSETRTYLSYTPGCCMGWRNMTTNLTKQGTDSFIPAYERVSFLSRITRVYLVHAIPRLMPPCPSPAHLNVTSLAKPFPALLEEVRRPLGSQVQQPALRLESTPGLGRHWSHFPSFLL